MWHHPPINYKAAEATAALRKTFKYIPSIVMLCCFCDSLKHRAYRTFAMASHKNAILVTVAQSNTQPQQQTHLRCCWSIGCLCHKLALNQVAQRCLSSTRYNRRVARVQQFPSSSPSSPSTSSKKPRFPPPGQQLPPSSITPPPPPPPAKH